MPTVSYSLLDTKYQVLVGTFPWIFESSLTNCYILYKKFHDLHECKYLGHYNFIKQVALTWINLSEYWSSVKQGNKQSTCQVHSAASTNTSIITCTTVAPTIISRRKKYLNQKIRCSLIKHSILTMVHYNIDSIASQIIFQIRMSITLLEQQDKSVSSIDEIHDLQCNTLLIMLQSIS